MKLYAFYDIGFSISETPQNGNVIFESETVAPILDAIRTKVAANGTPTECPPVEIISLNEETGESSTQIIDENALTLRPVTNDTSGGWYLVRYNTSNNLIRLFYFEKGESVSLPTNADTYKGSLDNLLNFLNTIL